MYTPVLGERGKLPEYLFAWNHLDFTGPNLIHPALDLFRPGLVHSFFGWPFIEALNQTIDQQAAILRGVRAFSSTSETCGVICAMGHLTCLFYGRAARPTCL
jgi:hypothetical protein